MPTVESLDEKLRARGRDKLTNEICRAFEPIKALLYYDMGKHPEHASPHDVGKIFTFADIFDAIDRRIRARHEAEYAQREVDAFLNEVENFKMQLDSLESSNA